MLFKSLSLLFCVLSRSNVPVFLTTQRRSLRPTIWTMVRPTSESFPVVMVGWGLHFLVLVVQVGTRGESSGHVVWERYSSC